MLSRRKLHLLRAIVRIASSILLVVAVLWTGAPSLVKAITESPRPLLSGAGGTRVGAGLKPAPTEMTNLPDPSAVGGDDRFGINFVNSVEANGLPPSKVGLRYMQATNAGARWTRWPMYWYQVQPSLEARDYSKQDAVVDLDVANGLQPHIILLGSPSWAASSGDPNAPVPKVGEHELRPLATPSGMKLSTVIAPPKNLDLPWNDPSNYWGQFVYETVLRYKDRVKVWEMWNEPDLFDGNNRPIFWSGTVAEYYRLLKVGYQAAKAADPEATVLFAGLSYWSRQSFFPDVLDYAIGNDPEGREAGFYFDVLPWHPYINPYYVYDWAARSRSQMQARGFVKPVWVNESHIPVCGEWATSCSPTSWYRATLEEQASYVIQAYSYAVAADVQRMSIFQLWDDGLAPLDYYGLAANSGMTRPSHRAYEVAATYLSRPSRVTRSPGSGYEMVVLEDTPQGKVTVVWATGGSDVQVAIPAFSTIARLVDQNGSVSNVTPSGGYYRPTLPRATNNRDPISGSYIMGGKPYLLVEPFFNAMASQVSSLPANAPDRSFVVSWTRLDNAGTSAVFDIQYRVGTSSSWVDWLTDTRLTSATFGPSSPLAVQEGQTYYFRSRLKESQGAIEPWPDGDGDTYTTIPFFLTGQVTDNRGIAIMGARVATSSFATTADANGNFRIAVPSGTYDLTASAGAYGTIPSPSVPITRSLSYNFVLPPVYNYVQNWGFEGEVSEWWVPSGRVSTSTDWIHSGAKSARLGEGNVQEDATLSQSGIYIPTGTYRPTVSFLYAVPSSAGTGDTFYLDVTGPAGTTSYSIPLDTGGAWAQKRFDLGDLSGSITLNFRLHKAGANQLRVFLDEVSVGKASGGPNTLYFPQIWKG